MNEIYSIKKCKGCHKVTILLKDEVYSTLANGKFISCAHCGCKKFISETPTSDLRDCMKSRRYKRNKHGAIEEIY